MTLTEFMSTYDPEGTRVVLDIDVTKEDPQANSPWIVVRFGDYAAVLTLMGVQDHLCIDVHPFVNGAKATAGVFGMSEGFRKHPPAINPEHPTTSHGWNSAALVSVLIGEQA